MAMAVLYINDGSGQLLGEIRGGVVTDYLPDTLGSCIGTVSSVGVVTSTTDYYPYGEVASSTGTNPSPWGFCGLLGYFADSLNRLYVRARVLRTDLTRWLTVDPLWPHEVAYQYVDLDPVIYSDSFGNAPQARRKVPQDGGGFGSCAVYVCSENTGPMPAFPGHKEVCVTSPDGGCSGGLYPDGNPAFSLGKVDSGGNNCKSGSQPIRTDPKHTVTCVLVLSGCQAARAACDCIKNFRSAPPFYMGTPLIGGTQNCYTFTHTVIHCAQGTDDPITYPIWG